MKRKRGGKWSNVETEVCMAVGESGVKTVWILGWMEIVLSLGNENKCHSNTIL